MVRTNKHWAAVILFGALATLPLVVTDALGDEVAMVSSGKEVFDMKCLHCHKRTKFTNLHYDRRTWEQIVARMERNTCVLSDAEYNAVCNYLAKEHGE